MLKKFESKKIKKQRTYQIILILLGIFIIFVSYKNISSEDYYVMDESDEAILYTGKDAIKSEKIDREELYGREIDNSLIDEYLAIHHDVIDGKYNNSDIVNYTKYEQKYNDIMILLAKSYSSMNNFDLNISDKLMPGQAGNFYENRNEQIDIYLNKTEFKNINPDKKDIEFLMDKTNDFKAPLKYKYYRGWEVLLSDFLINSIFFGIMSMIVASTIFSMDYENNMIEISHTTANFGKKLSKIKCKLGIIYTLKLFLIPHLIYALIILFFYGIDGFNSPIQLCQIYWESPYNLTFLQAYIITLLIATLSTIGLNLFVMLTSIISKRSIISILTGFVMLFSPIVIYNNAGLFVKKLLGISAINIYNAESLLINYFPVYNFFGLRCLQIYSVVPIIIFVNIVLFGGIYYRSKKI